MYARRTRFQVDPLIESPPFFFNLTINQDNISIFILNSMPWAADPTFEEQMEKVDGVATGRLVGVPLVAAVGHQAEDFHGIGVDPSTFLARCLRWNRDKLEIGEKTRADCPVPGCLHKIVGNKVRPPKGLARVTPACSTDRHQCLTENNCGLDQEMVHAAKNHLREASRGAGPISTGSNGIRDAHKLMNSMLQVPLPATYSRGMTFGDQEHKYNHSALKSHFSAQGRTMGASVGVKLAGPKPGAMKSLIDLNVLTQLMYAAMKKRGKRDSNDSDSPDTSNLKAEEAKDEDEYTDSDEDDYARHFDKRQRTN